MSVSTLLRKKTRQIANAKKCDCHLTSFYTKNVHKLEKLTLHLAILHQSLTVLATYKQAVLSLNRELNPRLYPHQCHIA